MITEKIKENSETPPLGGGPRGVGDPDDRRLRRTEKDIILPKLIREEARKKCPEAMKVFLDCAKDAGLLVQFKCQQANNAFNECLLSWAKKPEFIQEVTDNYINKRNHFRRTGEPLERYKRHKSTSSVC